MPVPLLRWGVTTWRKLEVVRDQIMRGTGTDEPWFMEHMADQLGEAAIAVHYRKPLTIEEINRMGQTPEVRRRVGRP
jgi:hypothetical protein